MNKIIFYLAILVSLMSLSFSNEPIEPIEDLIPLNIGNEWTYEKFEKDSENKIYTSTVTTNIKDTLIINNEVLYKIERTDNFYKDIYTCNRIDGVYEYDSGTKEFNLLFKFPCKVGDSSQIKDKIYKVVSTNSKIKIKGKAYSTICYQNKEDTKVGVMIYNIYVAKGIGVVRRELYLTIRNKRKKDFAIRDLISYKLIQKK